MSLKNFITASIESGLWGKNFLDSLDSLSKRDVAQLDKAFQINLYLGRLSGKQEYFEKAADIAERLSKHHANSKELKEAYANFAKELREGNFNRIEKMADFSRGLDRGIYVDFRGADLRGASLNISESIKDLTNNIRENLSKVNQFTEQSKQQPSQAQQKDNFSELNKTLKDLNNTVSSQKEAFQSFAYKSNEMQSSTSEKSQEPKQEQAKGLDNTPKQDLGGGLSR